MTMPVVNVIVNFSSGPSFAQAFVLDSGQLDVNILANAASVIVDVSDIVATIQTSRGRNITADQFNPGQMSLKLIDQDGNWNPQNTGGIYYGLLNPMIKVQVTATYGSPSVTYPIFSGFVTGFNTVLPVNGVDTVAYTTLTCVDAMRLANLAQVTTISTATAGQLTGSRINSILDQIAWPASMRDIDTGLTACQADPGTSRSALNAMQTVEITENGALFVNASGSFTFVDRNAAISSAAGVPVVYDDIGVGLAYADAKWQLSDILIYNNANVTAQGLTMQTATNAASVLKYFSHSVTQTGLLMQTNAEALNWGLAYVAARQETSTRCDLLTLDLYTPNYDLGIKAALALEFFDPVEITTAMPGSTSITKNEQVFGISHNITINSWRIDLITMEPVLDGLILDSALYGILDTSVLSY